jgi:dihydroorotase
LEKTIRLLSEHPRKIFQIPPATIEVGKEADITLFLPEVKYTFTTEDIRSRSKNSAFTGKELTGKVAGIIHKNKLIRHF